MRIYAQLLYLVLAAATVAGDKSRSSDFDLSLFRMPPSADLSEGSGGGHTYLTEYACQGDSVDIRCARPGDVIRVVRANYGRFSVAICNEEGRTDFSVNCLAPNSFSVMQNRCDDYNSCNVWADYHEFGGDPCNKTRKYIEVHYYCHDGTEVSTTTTTTERPLPPWMRRRTTLPPTTTTSTESTTTRRVPITLPPPTRERTTKARRTGGSGGGVVVGAGRAAANESAHIINRFLSSSISSTNIMDTSEVPVTLVSDDDSKGASSTTTTTTTTVPPATTRRNRPQSIFRNEVNVISRNAVRPVTPPPPPPAAVTPNPRASLANPPSADHCAPRLARTLSWHQWTRPGTTAVMPCPVGTEGLARWTCAARGGRYLGSHPELSGCMSVWLKRISEKLEGKRSVVLLAKDLVHFLGSHHLFGGDVGALLDVLAAMVDKMHGELSDIPTAEQRAAVVAEVVQSVVRSASALLDPGCVYGAWLDLDGGAERNRLVGKMMYVMEEAGRLAAAPMKDDDSGRETTFASRNILLSARERRGSVSDGVSVFPSASALASPHWPQFEDRVELTMDVDAAPHSAIFVAFKNLDLVSSLEERDIVQSEYTLPRMSSSLMSMAVDGATVGSAVAEMTFVHSLSRNASSSAAPPICARWDAVSGSWTADGCVVAAANSTHTTCKCGGVLSSFALMERGTNGGGERIEGVEKGGAFSDWLVVVLVVCGSVVFVGVVLLAFVVTVCCRSRSSMLHRPLKNSPSTNFAAASSICCCLRNSGDSSSPFDASPKMMGSSGSHELTLGSPDTEPSPTFFRQHSQHAGLLQAGTVGRGSGRGLPPQAQPQQARTMMGVGGRRDDMHLNLHPFPNTISGTSMTMNRSALMQPSSALLSPDGASDVHAHSMARVRDQRQVATSSRRWNQGTGTRLRRPVETPERPLLTDFPSSPGTPGSAQQVVSAGQAGSNQHIYMEVMDPWRNDFYQTPVESGYDNVVSRGASVPMQQLHHQHQHHHHGHQQQPHTLRLPADSSSSSQSSGYGSANFNNQSRQQQQQRPQNQGDAVAARPPRPTTLFQQRKRSGSRNRSNGGMLTLEDSQMI